MTVLERIVNFVSPANGTSSTPPPKTESAGLRINSKTLILNCGSGVTMELRLIPAGTFTMGSKLDTAEQPPHKVTVRRSFYMGIYSVTQAQYKAVMSENPSCFPGDNKPVENVTWFDANNFCQKISSLNSKRVVLPSEAMWEYACKAGSKGHYCYNDKRELLADYGWYDRNSSSCSHDVGRLKPNKFGLYDMHGNVLEWCGDEWHEDYENAPADERYWPSNDSFRIFRGGSWYSNADRCRAEFRDGFSPNNHCNNLGFRVAVSK
jgi:formylglycine-generating enzyme required for sulfatase activity